ncbi:MAG: hypothetical protein WAN48_09880 [Actinomycetes bacterium]
MSRSFPITPGSWLERHEETLLGQMTDALDPCPVCGNEDQYVTWWTPERTVWRIACAGCGEPMWSSPMMRRPA